MPLAMGVAMGIDVSGRAPHPSVTFFELAEECVFAGLEVLRVELTLVFAPDIPVQTDREVRIFLAQLDRFVERTAGDHEARAGEHALLVTIHDATIDTMRSAEIVGVENQ